MNELLINETITEVGLEEKVQVNEEVVNALFNLGMFEERITWLLKEKPEGYNQTIEQIYHHQYLEKIKPVLKNIKINSNLPKTIQEDYMRNFERIYKLWKENPFRPSQDYL